MPSPRNPKWLTKENRKAARSGDKVPQKPKTEAQVLAALAYQAQAK